MAARRLAVFAVVAGGCGKSAGTCKVEAHDLVAALRASDHEAPLLVPPEGVHLVKRDGLAHHGVAGRVRGMVAIGPTRGTTIDGELIDQAMLGNRLAHVIEPAHAYFAFDGDVPWSTVVAATESARAAGFDQVELVFERSLGPMPPPTPEEAELDRAVRASPDPAATLARYVTDAVSSCDAVKRVFSSVGSEQGDPFDQLVSGLEPALVECKCDVDTPKLRAALFASIRTSHPTASLTITLAVDGSELALPGATPWRDAQARILPGAKLHLVAR